MNYDALVWAHLATVLPCAILGAFLLCAAKGDRRHKAAGKVYLLLMLATALISLLLPAKVGQTAFGHFGLIHLLSVFVLWSVTAAYRAARAGQIARHKKIMISLYAGGIVIAGSAAMMPGRFLHSLMSGA